MTSALDTILFDLDDTLYDESTFVAAAFDATAAFVAAHSSVDRAEVRDALERRLQADGRGRIFDLVVDELGLDRRLAPAMVHTYRTTRPELTLYPDADAVLDQLRSAGARIGLVTDGMAIVQQNKVAGLGLVDRLDAIVYTGALPAGMGKPSTGGFETALAMLRSRPVTSCYVGNDVTKDFIGPRQLGMMSIMLNRRVIGDPATQPISARPDHVIADLAELPGLVGLIPPSESNALSAGRQRDEETACKMHQW